MIRNFFISKVYQKISKFVLLNYENRLLNINLENNPGLTGFNPVRVLVKKIISAVLLNNRGPFMDSFILL